MEAHYVQFYAGETHRCCGQKWLRTAIQIKHVSQEQTCIIRTNTPNQINVIVEKTTEIIPTMLKLLTS